MKLFAVTMALDSNPANLATHIQEYVLSVTSEAAKAEVLTRGYEDRDFVKVEEIEKDHISQTEMNDFIANFKANSYRHQRCGQAFLNRFDDVKSVKAVRWGAYLWQDDNLISVMNKVTNECGIVKYD